MKRMMFSLSLFLFTTGCASDDDSPAEVPEPPTPSTPDSGAPDDAPTLTACHPFAGTDTSPAVSQRSSTPPTKVTAWEDGPLTPALEGVLAVNEDLANAAPSGADVLSGAEDIAFDSSGRLYAATQEGAIWRAEVDATGTPGAFTRFATMPGGARPLGLALDACGNMLVAAPEVGLVGVSPEGVVRTLVDRVEGTLLEYADELSIAADGTVYVTDASVKYESAWPYDILEGLPHGRVVAYEPSTGATRVVVDGIYFANGIVVTPDESAILIAESLRARVIRHWLSGPDAGRTEPYAENLIAAPDNLTLDDDGALWTTGYTRTPELDALSASEQARLDMLALPLPELLMSFPYTPHVIVLVIGADGQVTRSLHSTSGALFPASSAVPHGGRLYVGRLMGPGIAHIALP